MKISSVDNCIQVLRHSAASPGHQIQCSHHTRIRSGAIAPCRGRSGGGVGAGGSSANKWPCAATSLLMAQPLYCHHPITNHHVPDSHRRLGPGRMTSEVETCHTDVPQTKTKQRLCCRIENWKLSSEGVIICKQRFNLSICSISALLESVTITTAATLHCRQLWSLELWKQLAAG